MFIEKIKTWKDNWNDIIRYVIFQDTRLKELMMVPQETTVLQFIDKYFMELESGSEILTNEAVRILYYDGEGGSTGNKNVKRHMKEFDIYVREDVLHNATNDRLQYRYDLITERLKYLILNYCVEHGLRFKFEDSYNLWTKTAGYRRYHAVFSYKTTV